MLTCAPVRKECPPSPSSLKLSDVTSRATGSCATRLADDWIRVTAEEINCFGDADARQTHPGSSQSPKVTPAMKSGLTHHVWSLEEML